MKRFGRCLAVVCLVSASLSAAPTVEVGPVVLPPGTPYATPVPPTTRAPRIEYPDAMRKVSDIGYVLVRPYGGNAEWGFFTAGTHAPFTAAVAAVVSDWKLAAKPGPEPALGWFPVIFNPASADPKAPDATPRLVRVTPVLLTPRDFESLKIGPVVRARVSVDAAGAVTDVGLAQPGDIRVLKILQLELSHWQFSPARQAGKPVAATLEVPVLLSTDGPSRYRFYAPAKESASRSRPATAVLTVLAIAPAELRGKSPDVTLDFTVDAEGVVHDPKEFSSNDPAFAAAALAVIPDWQFAPALRDGQPMTVRRRLKIGFVSEPKPAAVAARQVPPKLIRSAPPTYPREMLRSGISGEVTVEFVVGTDGAVKAAAIVKSNNRAFEQPALEAVRQWKFQPGTRDGAPIETRMQVPIVLRVEDDSGEHRELLEASAPSARASEKLPPELRYDTPPRFVDLVRPVYPLALQREGVTGRAVVAFLVDQRGRVALIEVREASRPEFGLALVAAMEASRFEPAQRAGQPTLALMKREQAFELTRESELVLEYDARLLEWERKRPEKIVAANRLDRPLKPVVRRAPEFPARLERRLERGEAMVEFLVDEEGKPRLPRVISATDPELGYAAMQAIVRWAYEPPMSGGKAVVVRVQQPFVFGPPRPKDAAATP